MNNRLVISSTIGFMCIGLTLWMGGMLYAGWFPLPGAYGYGGVTLFTLGTFLLGVMAVLSFFHGRTLDAIIFFGVSGLFFTLHAAMRHGMMMGAPADSGSYPAWFDFVFAVFFFYVWLGSFRSGGGRMLFLLGMWLALLVGAIYHWTHVEFFVYICGYILLITAITATYISAAEIINYGNGKMVLPTGSKDA